MNGTDTFGDVSPDYERFEAERFAQDHGAEHVVVADVEDREAHLLVNTLVDDGLVTPVPNERVLVHEPSDVAFNSIVQLAVFHRGWTAALDVDAKTGEDVDL